MRDDPTPSAARWASLYATLGSSSRRSAGSALAVAGFSSDRIGTASRYAVIVLLAVAMGMQNATARKLAVPDLTTTVLTMTLTGVAADSTLAGGPGSKLGRRGLSVAAMLVGALVGGTLIRELDTAAPLALATALLAAISLLTYRASRSTPPWTRAGSED